MKTALFCCLALTLLSLSATETRRPPDRKKSLCRNVFNRQEQPRSMFVPTAGINRKKPGISFLRQESSAKPLRTFISTVSRTADCGCSGA